MFRPAALWALIDPEPIVGSWLIVPLPLSDIVQLLIFVSKVPLVITSAPKAEVENNRNSNRITFLGINNDFIYSSHQMDNPAQKHALLICYTFVKKITKDVLIVNKNRHFTYSYYRHI